jgi:hypothetical protein
VAYGSVCNVRFSLRQTVALFIRTGGETSFDGKYTPGEEAIGIRGETRRVLRAGKTGIHESLQFVCNHHSGFLCMELVALMTRIFSGAYLALSRLIDEFVSPVYIGMRYSKEVWRIAHDNARCGERDRVVGGEGDVACRGLITFEDRPISPGKMWTI